jgi:GT2 family glycosyltransferase
MRLLVIIVTFARRDVLARTLAHLERQTRAPDLVIVSAPDPSHVDAAERSRRCPLTHVFGAHGCTAQRNRALDAADIKADDIVTFLDDDFVPADDYLEVAEASLRHHPDFAVVTGRVVYDGVKGPGLSFDEGLAILAEDAGAALAEPEIGDRHGAYGCNMSMRASDIGALRFDERLPLYGWQEDTDFSRRLARGRRIVRLAALRGVHLGVKGGRINGLRFGYSQVANPIYLVRKGSLPMAAAARLMFGNIAANAFGTLRPEAHIDRPGRLRGNLLAGLHVLIGRLQPEFVLKL